MRKNFKFYILIWAILLIMFNAVVFLARPVIPGYEIRYDARFWIAWLFVTAAFAGNLLCANKAFLAKNSEKLFYKVPLITISYTGLIAMAVLGSALMLIPNCPAWIAAIVCAAAAAFTALAVIKADWAAGAVEDTEKKVKENTAFIRDLTVDAEGLAAYAKSDEAKAACKRVYEALRYSDPMSSDALLSIENSISEKLEELSAAVKSDSEAVPAVANELINLVEDRNRRCRRIK